MESIIIYFSYHRGNTSKIAHIIARELHSDLVKFRDIYVKELLLYDIIGLGSGIYNGKPHRSLYNLIDKLDDRFKDKYFFLFCTSRKNKKSYLTELSEKIKSKGFNYLGKFQTFGEYDKGIFKLFGGINRGRPNIQDFDDAVKFTKKIKEGLNEKLEND